ncbi:hypothetical protein BOTBODRAFT_399311 [Botryobasidium botryosum FD-172 SS1]|uniref:Uncharacterized protein n=1 Tax=Botryobasidium botryosum (strain FD-172 SS1) TaxID=930990 RepID=A0A067MBY8_BOTB1|nr:hypothetical protein BOTBODRAFT_399311 [Botryobasidium botryosum FD-172 SS1]
MRLEGLGTEIKDGLGGFSDEEDEEGQSDNETAVRNNGHREDTEVETVRDRGDEVEVKGRMPASLHDYIHDSAAKWLVRDSELSASDTSRAIRLLEHLSGIWVDFLCEPPGYPFLSDNAVHACRDRNCSRIFKKLWPIHVATYSGCFNPLDALQDIIRADWEARGICVPCAFACRKVWQEKRQAIWDEIGKKFGVVDE